MCSPDCPPAVVVVHADSHPPLWFCLGPLGRKGSRAVPKGVAGSGDRGDEVDLAAGGSVGQLRPRIFVSVDRTASGAGVDVAEF
jgi:hypothetical protein